MKGRIRLPALERLKKQIAQLEWLLVESGFEPGDWDVEATSDEDADGLVLGLILVPKGRRTIRVTSVPDPRAEHLEGDRHFWIDGNHWYEEHAVGALKTDLAEALTGVESE